VQVGNSNDAAGKKIVFETAGKAPYVFDLPLPEKKADAKPVDGKAADAKKNQHVVHQLAGQKNKVPDAFQYICHVAQGRSG